MCIFSAIFERFIVEFINSNPPFLERDVQPPPFRLQMHFMMLKINSERRIAHLERVFNFFQDACCLTLATREINLKHTLFSREQTSHGDYKRLWMSRGMLLLVFIHPPKNRIAHVIRWCCHHHHAPPGSLSVVACRLWPKRDTPNTQIGKLESFSFWNNEKAWSWKRVWI